MTECFDHMCSYVIHFTIDHFILKSPMTMVKHDSRRCVLYNTDREIVIKNSVQIERSQKKVKCTDIHVEE